MKKLILLLLMAASPLLTNTVFAYDFSAVCSTGQTLFYNITSNEEPYTVEVTNETGSAYNTYPAGDLEIPETVEYNSITYSVTSIGENAFEDCSSLTTIIIPNTVIVIDRYAFSYCSGLMSVTIGNGVLNINIGAFSLCNNLSSVYYTGDIVSWCRISFEFSDNPLYYAHNLYINNELVTDLVIPETVTEINSYAFYEATCLTSVEIPSSIISIGEWAFAGCSGLTSVYYSGDIAGWCGITFGDERANPLSTGHNLYINNELVTDLVIPETVTEINSYAFYGTTSLLSVTIANSVTNIGDYVFGNCNFQEPIYNANCFAFFPNGYANEYTVPSGIKRIAGGAFSDCTNLTTVIIPESVTSIGNYAFYQCSGLMDTITIPNLVNSIGEWAFMGCRGLTSITFPNSVTSIGSHAFRGCTKLGSVTFGDSVLSIGSQAFDDCSLFSVSIPNTVTSIGFDAFEGTKNIVYDGSADGSPWGALTINGFVDGYLVYFDDTKNNLTGCSKQATEVTIPNSVTSIGEKAFKDCENITVIIPELVTSIGNEAFNHCDNAVVYFNAINCTADNVFSGTSMSMLYIGENVSDIQGDVFYYISVDTLDYNAHNCSNISFNESTIMTLIIGDNVESVPDNAFQNYIGLSNISYNAVNCETFGANNSITNNEYIASITIGKNVETIPDGVFEGGNSIIETLNYNARYCRSKPFANNINIMSLNIGDSVSFISDSAFFGCSGLSSVAFPNEVSNIGMFAFFDCNGLTSVTIGDSFTDTIILIGANAFVGCTNIDEIVTYANIPPILEETVFDETTYSNATVLTPCGFADDYRNDSQWGQFANIRSETTTVFNIEVQSNSPENGSVTGTGTYSCETEATITAIANQGYRFLSWNDGNTDNPRTITVTSDSTFVATFRTRAGNSDILCNEPCPVTTDQTMSQTNIPYYAPEELSYRAGDQVEICVTIQCPTTISVNNMGGTITSLAINELENVPSGFTYCVSNTELDPTNYAFATIWFTGVATEAGEYNIRIGGDLTGTLNSTPVTEEAVSIETGINITIYSENSKIIRVLSNNDAYGSVSGGGFYDENWEAVISATPNQGYRFVQWNDGNTDNPRTIIVTEDATYTAIFEASTYTITATAGENGTISPSGEVTVVEGENQSFTITANDGYRISSVLVDETEDVTNQVENGVYTFENVTASHDIEATFEAIPSASFTTNPEASGDTLSIMLEQLVEYTSTSINAHHIVWTFEGTDTVESTQTYVPVRYSEEGVFLTTLVAYNEDETLTDTATLTVVVREASYYTITAVSANDAYGSVSGGGTYAEGTTATLTATPNQGYRFASWDDGNTNNPRTITVTSDSTFVANFARSSNSSSDIQAKFYADADATVEAGTSMTIPMEEDFVIYPALYNGGPDVATDSVYVDIQVNGSSILQDDVHFLSLESDPIEADNIKFILAQNALTFTAADLDQAALSSFEICFIANYSGNDPNSSNNTTCINVTRRTASTDTTVFWSCDFEGEEIWTFGNERLGNVQWQIVTPETYPEMLVTDDGAYLKPFIYQGDTLCETPGHWAMVELISQLTDFGGPGQVDEGPYIQFDNIDLNGVEHPQLYFNQIHRHFNAETVVRISTDGGATWFDHVVNADVENQEYGDTYIRKRLSIIEAAHNTASIRFQMNGTGEQTQGYGWEIDDIKIVESPACDLILQDARISMFGYIDYRDENALLESNETRETAYQKYDPYAQSPRRQWFESNGFAAFNVEVFSNGYEDVTPMARIKVKNPSGEEIYNKVVAGIRSRPLSINESDTIDFGYVEYDLSSIFYFDDINSYEDIPIGRYTVDFYVFAEGLEDADTTDNHTTQYFEITDNTYSTSYDEPTSYLNYNNRYSSSSSGDEYGTVFTYNYNPGRRLSIDAYIDGNTTVGTKVMARIYEINENIFNLFSQSELLTITDDMLGSWVNFPFEDDFNITPQGSSYTFLVTIFGSWDNEDDILAIGTSDVLTSKGFNSYLHFAAGSDDEWYYGMPQLAIRVIENMELNEYNIEVLSNNDSYGMVSGGGTYEEGASVVISATPYEGFRFVSWNDDNTDNPRRIMVTSDSTFVAMFEAEQTQQFSITVLSNNDAYGSVSGGGTYNDGDTIMLMAMPNGGYLFDSWEDDNFDNPRTITVTSDSIFIADFVKCEITQAIDTIVPNFVTVGEHTFYSTGRYSFEIQHETDCDTIYDINLTVLAEPEPFDIEPNPAKSIVNIHSDGFISYVEFYSPTGQLVMRKEVNGNFAECDVEAFAPGVYIVRIYGEESNLPSVYKIVKE